MTATITVRLIELEPSAGAYDGSKVDANAGGYVEVNQTYSEITVTDTIRMDADDPISGFKKRMLQYIFGTPNPTAYIVGKERR